MNDRRALLAAALTALAATPARLPDLEQLYADVREAKDQIEVTEARGARASTTGTPLAELQGRYAALRARLVGLMETARPGAVGEEARAREAMRSALADALPAPEAGPARETGAKPPCDYDAAALAAEGLDALSRRIYACYGEAARNVRYGDETIDRLTVFARLAETADAGQRRRLFLALDPVWRSVNGDDSPASPYRQLVKLSARRWAKGDSPIARNLAALGIAPDAAERWLTAVLETWRDATPSEPIEPWDLHHSGGALNRALGARVPKERLRQLNDAFYRALGADPLALGVRYDLEPRDGKTPVAFTTFGQRPRLHGKTCTAGEAWIFATYREAGLDNLAELLHETGHAVHIVAIRARPAFADWPDSDTFTEALADLIALEAYEPAWQQRWLGAAAPLADSLRSKYAGIVLDVAWSLFEVRMHRAPDADPNQVWSELTREYLHVTPHPELSWWAMRGQLVDAPGYMMNYGLGSLITAELRARCRALRGPFERPDPGYYAWLCERLYRFGLAKASRAVIEDFLGRPLSPDALIADMARAKASGATPCPKPDGNGSTP
jgi:hypothetical protein